MCLHCILEGGKKFWFTSLEHHKREEERRARKKKRRKRRSVKLLPQGCEVILSLVESSVLVDRPFLFFNSLKQRGDKSFLFGTGNKTRKEKQAVESSGSSPLSSTIEMSKESSAGGEKSLYCVLRSSFRSSSMKLAGLSRVPLGFGVLHSLLSPSVDAAPWYMYRESGQRGRGNKPVDQRSPFNIYSVVCVARQSAKTVLLKSFTFSHFFLKPPERAGGVSKTAVSSLEGVLEPATQAARVGGGGGGK